jgi:hypothetical protein
MIEFGLGLGWEYLDLMHLENKLFIPYFGNMNTSVVGK